MKSIVQIISTTKTLWITSVSNVIVSGIDTAPTKRSAKATLDSRMFEFFFNSLLVFTAIIDYSVLVWVGVTAFLSKLNRS